MGFRKGMQTFAQRLEGQQIDAEKLFGKKALVTRPAFGIRVGVAARCRREFVRGGKACGANKECFLFRHSPGGSCGEPFWIRSHLLWHGQEMKTTGVALSHA